MRKREAEAEMNYTTRRPATKDKGQVSKLLLWDDEEEGRNSQSL
jgi:hypothetical protein